MSVLQTIDLKKYYVIEPNITRALDGVNFSGVVLSVALDGDTGDRKFSADVLDLRKRTSGEFNQTIVMMTHNNELARLADRMVRIEDGKMWDKGVTNYDLAF